MSHFGIDKKYYESMKLERSLIRLSIDCEPYEIIISDLEKILN